MIGVIGMGKAGLPLACAIASSGLEVLGIDVDKKRIAQLQKKENPIPEEPGIADVLEKHVGKNLFFSDDPLAAAKECTAHIIIVPLFIDEETKKPDFSIIDSVCETLGQGLKQDDLVVLETTVPPGTTGGHLKALLEKESGLEAGKDFFLAHSPERIMTGYSLSRFKEFPKIVGGIDDASTEKAYALYSTFCNAAEKVSDAKTAELVKVAEGVYRDVNIALANELRGLCEEVDVDFWELREKANHQFCNIHEAGLGVGGHCIPVYPWFLINEHLGSVPLTAKAREINDLMVDHYVAKVKARLSAGGSVAVLGLAYREGVKEIAYARTIPFIKRLLSEGFSVFVADPHFSAEEIKQITGAEILEDPDAVDLLVHINKEPAFRDLVQGREEKTIFVKPVKEDE